MAKQITKAKKEAHGTKRAAIYVRVSSEKQAEKVSPEAQETDARTLCERQGYIVAEVYRDTEKYRVNGRMVEPSGTRQDRPQFKRMLRDADAGLFDVIIAWREDRLYRGVNRAMLEISERVKSKAITVELVKEHYDPAIAEVKAWAAGVELQARRDRTAMGVTARLMAGKVWYSNPPYGYDYDKLAGQLVVNESEAHWVRLIWQWYAEGASVKTIQKRLITAGAQQKGVTSRKYVWSLDSIRRILNRDGYYTGQTIIRRDGTEYFLCNAPQILDSVVKQLYGSRKGVLHDQETPYV
jgi:site-specific DNA recombinase